MTLLHSSSGPITSRPRGKKSFNGTQRLNAPLARAKLEKPRCSTLGKRHLRTLLGQSMGTNIRVQRWSSALDKRIGRRMLRQVGIVVVTACASWSLCYTFFGGTSNGKTWYGQFASKFWDDSKGGVPLVTLAIPVLLAGSVSALLNVASSGRTAMTIAPWMHSLVYKWSPTSGDVNFNRLSFLFILVPLSIYLLASIKRHLYGQDLSYNDTVMEVGNSFAMVALVAFSYFLIPVARHSAILKLLNWTPVAAVRLHIWSGRIIIVGVLMHGTMHMYRWVGIAGENLLSMILPPAPCWTFGDTEFRPTCNDSDSDCSCYDHFRNLTGVLAAVGLVVIAITAVGYVRRNHYRVFYMAHVMAAPLVIIMSILHWKRSVLYMAPSLLYYVASSIPVMMESAVKMKKDGGVQVVSVQKITSSDGRPCVSLTVAASDATSLQSGQYIKLSAPEISSVYHPFTVNRVNGTLGHLRIIFRVTGPFTSKLANQLVDGTKPPLLEMDGFHGTTKRVDQVLKHDVVVMVAGGIGITPYLSLLQEVHSISHSRQESKEIVLHWICRNAVLVKYVKAHYFHHLVTKSFKSNFRMRLIVHKTSRGQSNVTGSGNLGHQMSTESEMSQNYIGEPFSQSRFSSGKNGIIGNLTPFVTFSAIGWVGLWAVWYVYEYAIHENEIVGRAWACLAIVTVAVFVASIATLVLYMVDKPRSRRHNPTLIEDSEEDNIEIEMGSEGNGITKETLGDERSDDEAAVSYEEKIGRPTIRELLKSLDGAQHPGLFLCGPKSLMQALRAESQEKCVTRKCMSGAPQTAIYEECFET
jgi:predicted ferric reductase